MKCIYCGHQTTDVVNSRKTKEGTSVWRRRRCASCKIVFTTEESAFSNNIFIVKRNKKQQRFSYEKLFVSIFTALAIGKERDNGDLASLAKKITEKVVLRIIEKKKKIITTKEVMFIVYEEMSKINKHDATTYMLYSSYRKEVLSK